MKTRILQIAGTDTEIGKTTVGSLLTAALVERGFVPWVMKPIQTDCVPDETGELVPSDAVQYWEASGKRQTLREVIAYRFRSPVAPVVASEVEGVPIDFEGIAETLLDAAEKSPLVLYEGAGGILVPMTREKTFLDLAKAVSAATVVVMGSRLGAINHSALTFHTLRSEGLPCLGYVFNDLFAEDAALEAGEKFPADALRTNRKLLAKVAEGYGLRELAALPRLATKADGLPFIASLADEVIRHFELEEFASGR